MMNILFSTVFPYLKRIYIPDLCALLLSEEENYVEIIVMDLLQIRSIFRGGRGSADCALFFPQSLDSDCYIPKRGNDIKLPGRYKLMKYSCT
ncbi:hypothetical protein GDO81_016763 [Engystomops pustulosus]|uniref:Uncharacterized protein n=1 Tax=Engystomops pustulosus TaxID=76066 RepID=A0AAV7A8S3_ENGPU|nr:hypothetical protein GDO81_016763 [Engystomops pustulosus]